MRNFEFLSPTKIIFGKETHKQVGSVIRSYGYKKVLIHYGMQHIKKTGLYDQVVESLNEAGIQSVELGGVQPNPVLSTVRKGIDLCRQENVDFILAVGGGSVIDSAKAIGMGVPYTGDVWDFFEGKAPEKTVPLGVILTIAAAGSETSKNTVITNEETLTKRGAAFDCNRPVFAIMNPELTYTLPAYQTACGVVDIMAHVMERYFSTERNVELTDRLCEGVLKTVISNAHTVLNEPNNYEARAEIMFSGSLAHNGYLGLGRTEEWVAHRMGHEISAFYGATHGETLAIMFPAWMKYVYKHDTPMFAKFFNRVFDVEYDFFRPENTVLRGIERLEDFYKSLGLKTRLRELNVDPSLFPEMAKKANSRGKLGNILKLEDEDLVKIYELAY
jgi:alcohol dehydrogenase YqhD (iron-dependent ADH family)